MKSGADQLADAVKVTLGPMGRNVIIRQDHNKKPMVTKDGVTVARVINLEDKYEDMGAQLVKMASEKTAMQAGDGTTTSALLAQVIIREGMLCLEAGGNPVDIKRGMDEAVSMVVENLKRQSVPVDAASMVSIATISANNDPEIGELVSHALDLVGVDGVVHLQDGKTSDTQIEVMAGIHIDKGYISQYFINNIAKMKVELEDCLILVYERKISTYIEIEEVLKIANANNRSLLIIAEDVDGEALATMVKNKIDGGRKWAAIKLPGFGNMQQQMLEDIAVMIGAKVVSPAQGHVLKDIKAGMLGRAKSVIITNTATSIIGGGGTKAAVAERVEQVKSLIEDMHNEFERDKMRKQRLALLTNGIAVIHVGAATDVELREKKDRIDDALCATKAAREEGIVPGGGSAYIRAMMDLPGEFEIPGETMGLNIIKAALESPLRQILENAGIILREGIVNEVREGKLDFGFNAKSGLYANMFEAGVIDSTKVARVALENASSVGGMFLTTACAIVNAQ